jgi:demethylmenaquinone methyltransferase/2-methoxy-6-polyprenyl-1,4-benzoquinol methylase
MPDPKAVKSMFERIAGRYDLANRLLSGGADTIWRRCLVRKVRDSRLRVVLDLATGSGDVAFALAEGLGPGVRLTGMDFCQPMLDEAVKKRELSARSAAIEFRQGDGLALPLDDRTYDAVTISFGLRNMADRHKSLTEMHRVLRPGGKLFVLEFSQPYFWFRPAYYGYVKFVLPIIAGLVTGDRAAYEYLCGSIEKFPNRQEITDEIRKAGFSEVHATALTFGIVALHEASR